MAAALSGRIGGPSGEHSRGHRWWTPVRVLLALAAVAMSLAIVKNVPCVNTEWANSDVRYARLCYSDVPYLYTGRGMAEHVWPYADTGGRYQAMEYPVGISYFAWAAGELTGLAPAGPSQEVRAATPVDQLFALPGMRQEVNDNFLLTGVLLGMFALLATWFLAGTHRRRPWDALPFVLSPCLVATGLVNWDLLAVALTCGSLWAWSRGRPLLAGVMVGLGTATKLYPAFLLGAFLVVALRRRQPVPFVLAAVAAAVAWVLANAPAYLSGPQEWAFFWRFNADRGADLGSVWLLAGDLGFPASIEVINIVSWAFFGLACLAVLALGLLAPQPPRVAQLAFVVVAAFLLINKVYSPQYVLWLLPLAVLARPRWRDLLWWQAGEMVYFVAVWLYLGGWLTDAGGTASPAYDVAIVVRLVVETALVAVVVRDVLRPERDPARPPGEPWADPLTPTTSRVPV